ncbi:hemin ABC transporter ATP-binding protein [Gordonia effusa NBRC 100432]|uniref:Hemin ABC transporter ATP-binding protein n=1 Tax=Gordonia effusa NBRC 100432 TaxID=1077974 RepID=H0R260_9ACTN|nr:heme ABC transporter ATP-binding protein [Gordonia effusa]GAB19165.1 hemin ABC transporter ATP-binding protein [Gordonia effusa NBRC 100432]
MVIGDRASVLAAHNVSIALDGRQIVSDVELSVASGEIVALVGPNGCGKSTLLSALGGFRAPSSGHVELCGEAVSALAAKEMGRRRAVVTQHNRPDIGFTVGEVVEMGRYPWTRTPQAAESARIIAEAIADCDLAELVDRPVSRLSGGQQARVSLARALAQRTPVLLLDEPTAALDIAHQEATLQVLRRARDRGVAILIVVHDLSLAAAYADRVALMKSGRIVASGTPETVLTDTLLSEIYDHPVEIIAHPRTGQSVIVPRRE